MKNDKENEKLLVVSVPEGATIIRDNAAGSTYNTPVFPKGTTISLKDVPAFEPNYKAMKELTERCEKAEARCKEAELRALESALRAKEAEKAAKNERALREREAYEWCAKVRQARREAQYWRDGDWGAYLNDEYLDKQRCCKKLEWPKSKIGRFV